MNITVYLGASEGNDPKYRSAVVELGRSIGESGNTLVYGGSAAGLMGALAKSALEAGAKVIGVEPRFFVESAMQLEGLTELIVAEDMPQRKTKMIELGDAFVVFPGGTGTLDEASEILSLTSLELLDAPCVFYNLDGYYEPLRRFLEQMKACGFSNEERLRRVFFADSLTELRHTIGF